jgi:hypothetical protein
MLQRIADASAGVVPSFSSRFGMMDHVLFDLLIGLLGEVIEERLQSPEQNSWVFDGRQGELKDGAMRLIRIGPQPAPMSFNDGPADR